MREMDTKQAAFYFLFSYSINLSSIFIAIKIKLS